MASALATVSDVSGTNPSLQALAARATFAPSDEFRFRKESPAPSGMISWPQGEQLIKAARGTLAAGAKSYRERLRYFSNRYGSFANRYLESVLMGQTAPGSYIVTAFAPTSMSVPFSAPAPAAPPTMFESAVASGSTREIGLTVMKAAVATVEAVAHYRQSGSMSAFEALVPEGVSFEMSVALRALATDSDGADIVVEWDPGVRLNEGVPSRVELSPSDAGVLERASHILATAPDEVRTASFVGRVVLLTTQDVGGPGVLGIENLAVERPRKIRVHLAAEDYVRALRAHEEGRAVRVQGRLERDGNLHWLYDTRLLAILGRVDEEQEALKLDRRSGIPADQTSLAFDDEEDEDLSF